MFTEIYCTVQGKVQNVGYRDFVQRTAKEYALMGWVRNDSNGRVEVIAQGFPDNLKEFVEKLHGGSVLAQVESVAVDWRTPEKHFDDFIVIF